MVRSTHVSRSAMTAGYPERLNPCSGSCISPARRLPAQAMPRSTRNRSRSVHDTSPAGMRTRSTSSLSASSSPHPRGRSVRGMSPAGAASQNSSARPHHTILANLHRPASRRSIATSSSSSRRTVADSSSRHVPRRSSRLGPASPPRRRRPARRPLSISWIAARRPSSLAAWPPSRAKSAFDTLHSIMHVLGAHRTNGPLRVARRSVHPATSTRNPPVGMLTSSPTATHPAARSQPPAARLRA